MWTVVYMSAKRDCVQQVIALLKQNDILIKIHEICETDSEDSFFEILVPDAEVSKSQEIIFESEI